MAITEQDQGDEEDDQPGVGDPVVEPCLSIERRLAGGEPPGIFGSGFGLARRGDRPRNSIQRPSRSRIPPRPGLRSTGRRRTEGKLERAQPRRIGPEEKAQVTVSGRHASSTPKPAGRSNDRSDPRRGRIDAPDRSLGDTLRHAWGLSTSEDDTLPSRGHHRSDPQVWSRIHEKLSPRRWRPAMLLGLAWSDAEAQVPTRLHRSSRRSSFPTERVRSIRPRVLMQSPYRRPHRRRRPPVMNMVPIPRVPF